MVGFYIFPAQNSLQIYSFLHFSPLSIFYLFGALSCLSVKFIVVDVCEAIKKPLISGLKGNTKRVSRRLSLLSGAYKTRSYTSLHRRLFIIIADVRSAAAIRDYLPSLDGGRSLPHPPSLALLAFFSRACTLPQKVERSVY